MKVEHEVVEPALVKPPHDRVDRGPLLRDEKHPLPRASKVETRLAIVWLFPVPGGPLDDQILAAHHGVDRVVLARIGV